MNEGITLDFLDSLAIADTAARCFADARTRKIQDLAPDIRTFCRQNSVRSLRWLWRNSDAWGRVTVAVRVKIWMRGILVDDDLTPFQQRILAREKARKGTS